MCECDESHSVDCIDEKASCYTARFRSVVRRPPSPILSHPFFLLEQNNDPGGIGEMGLDCRSYVTRSSSSAASRIFCFNSWFEIATHVHGCKCAPLGAVPPERMPHSISDRATGLDEKCLVVRRALFSRYASSAICIISTSEVSDHSRATNPLSSMSGLGGAP